MEIEDMKKKYEQLQAKVSEHIQITQLRSLVVRKLVSDKSCSLSVCLTSLLVAWLVDWAGISVQHPLKNLTSGSHLITHFKF